MTEINGRPAGRRLADGGLLTGEESWVARFDFLKSRGYLLRPRYRPGWVHSWKDKKGVFYLAFEDSIEFSVRRTNSLADRASFGLLMLSALTETPSP